MGAELLKTYSAARQVLEEVDEALQQNLSRLIASGNEETLTLTENAQPAIMAIALASFKALCQESGLSVQHLASYMAGHSLGEYSALAASGAVSIGDCARLLRLRGQAMQQAQPVGEGSMAAILGLTLEQLEPCLAEGCGIANDNAPGQIVISGSRGAVLFTMEACKTAGAKRAVLLNVSAAFHSPFMQPAAPIMQAALADVAFAMPLVPIINNITAEPCQDAAVCKELLVQQVTGRVRWRESVLEAQTLGITQQLECGHGGVLTGLAKRIAPSIKGISLDTPAAIQEVVKSMEQHNGKAA
jgi:[acyl-carrier-protein] S-malonyltransferase